MLRNYLITAFRSLGKRPTHTFVNLAGLSMGITSAIVIFLMVRFELSHDRFHPDHDRIYRLVTEFTDDDTPGYTAGTTYPLPEALRSDFPDLEHVVLVDRNFHDPVISVHRQGEVDRFKETAAVFVDPEYFKIFGTQWIVGDLNALEQNKSVVLTESAAKKYFGDVSPLDKVLSFNEKYDLTVRGVIKDPPANTDFQFSVFISSKLGADKRGWETWASTAGSLNCFVKLKPSVKAAQFNEKLKGWHIQYFIGENADDALNRTYFLQPLDEVHSDSRFSNFSERIVTPETIWVLAFIGFLLLITACINFINLNTVLIFRRARETGVRKTLGGTPRQLMGQFLGETFIISFLALIMSAGFAELILLNLHHLTGYRLALSEMFDLSTLGFMLLLSLLVTALAGGFPAMKLARFNPYLALKGKLDVTGRGNFGLRRALIVLQLVISQGLVAATIVVINQIDYFLSRPLGLKTEAVLEFHIPEKDPVKLRSLKERLLTLPGVTSATMSNTGSISDGNWGGEFQATHGGETVEGFAQIKYADESFLDTYGVDLLAGRDLSPSDSSNQYLANEQLISEIGVSPEDAIGIPLEMWGRKGIITGVVRNFNTTPLHEQISPLLITRVEGSYSIGAVKLKTADLAEGVSAVGRIWQDLFSTYIFESSFLDDTISNFYNEEKSTRRLMSLFSITAILIGCIGLFGLVSFMSQQKTKEIGIRKTFGASINQIVVLFVREFGLLVLISAFIAFPIVYYLMLQWLENFAYKVPLTGTEFLVGLVATMVVVGLTVGHRSLKAALANPVDSLKTE